MPSPRALPPHPAIRTAVLGYFAVGPRPEAHRQRILPDGCVDLVFNLSDAQQSEFLSRMLASDPFQRMPQGPTHVPDGEGIAVLSDWVSQMSPAGCP